MFLCPRWIPSLLLEPSPKPFLPVALVMVFHQSNRKVTKTACVIIFNLTNPLIYCCCISVCDVGEEYMCHSMCVEVRGQVCGAGFLLHLYEDHTAGVLTS